MLVIYLDGKEVRRLDVKPEVPDTPELLSAYPMTSRRLRTTTLRVDRIEPGEHVLAISLHNDSPDDEELFIGEISLHGLPAEPRKISAKDR